MTDRPDKNGVDPDQMLPSVASVQYLHCLLFIQQFFDTSVCSKILLSKFKDYSQTCVKQAPWGKQKSSCLRQVLA